MSQRYLQGIQFDLCREGDGVWLDPGEQRYLMAWAQKPSDGDNRKSGLVQEVGDAAVGGLEVLEIGGVVVEVLAGVFSIF